MAQRLGAAELRSIGVFGGGVLGLARPARLHERDGIAMCSWGENEPVEARLAPRE